jgi:hypothetical protein
VEWQRILLEVLDGSPSNTVGMAADGCIKVDTRSSPRAALDPADIK